MRTIATIGQWPLKLRLAIVLGVFWGILSVGYVAMIEEKRSLLASMVLENTAMVSEDTLTEERDRLRSRLSTTVVSLEKDLMPFLIKHRIEYDAVIARNHTVEAVFSGKDKQESLDLMRALTPLKVFFLLDAITMNQKMCLTWVSPLNMDKRVDKQPSGKIVIERYALEECKLVGMLQEAKLIVALVRDPKGEIHTVGLLDQIGVDHSVVHHIERGAVHVVDFPVSDQGHEEVRFRAIHAYA